MRRGKRDSKGQAGGKARRAAAQVLLRVARDEAYADLALDAVLRRSPLKEADRGLATELVYGTLRNTQLLDFYLGQYTRDPLHKLPKAVLCNMRMALYQILFLRIPDYSAVNEAVSLVRETHRHLAGLTNAILRKLARLRDEDQLPKVADQHADAAEVLAIEGSHPLWLVRRMVDSLGLEAAQDWVAANNKRPPLAMRVNTLRTSRDALAKRLTEAGLDVSLPEHFPEALLLLKGGKVDQITGFAEGHFAVQDPAAQLVAPLLAPADGSTIVDACAAPGGKSVHLGTVMNNTGKVIAVDVHRAKTRLIQESAQRLGTPSVRPACADARDVYAMQDIVEEEAGETTVDAVLVDAPCSGMGTLRRNPELRQRRDQDLDELCATQDALLDSAAALVRPGGHLVYSVCTITAEEGPDRVTAFLERHPEFAPSASTAEVLEPFFVSFGGVAKSAIVTWPHLHDADGFFAVRLQRFA